MDGFVGLPPDPTRGSAPGPRQGAASHIPPAGGLFEPLPFDPPNQNPGAAYETPRALKIQQKSTWNSLWDFLNKFSSVMIFYRNPWQKFQKLVNCTSVLCILIKKFSDSWCVMNVQWCLVLNMLMLTCFYLIFSYFFDRHSSAKQQILEKIFTFKKYLPNDFMKTLLIMEDSFHLHRH